MVGGDDLLLLAFVVLLNVLLEVIVVDRGLGTLSPQLDLAVLQVLLRFHLQIDGAVRLLRQNVRYLLLGSVYFALALKLL